MDEREFEQLVERLMKQDFSIGTEEFSESLLSSCQAMLDADEEGAPVDDALLELLSAAGDGLPPDPFLNGER